MNAPPNPRLFILGAGFSAPAGLPLGPLLYRKVRSGIKAGYSSEYGWDGNLEKEADAWSRLHPGKKQKLESILGYSHLKHRLGLNGSKRTFSQDSMSVLDVQRKIQEIFIRETPARPPALYLEFAKRLRPGDVVFTFNYDTLLEQALEVIGKPFSLTPSWWLEEDAGNVPTTFVDIIKLHGSIDWYDRNAFSEREASRMELCDDSPSDDPAFSPGKAVKTESLAKGEIGVGLDNHHLLERVVRVIDHREKFWKYLPQYQCFPFFLPPSFDKLLGYDPIYSLWENMHRVTQDYSAVIMIGYSMPEYDGYAFDSLGELFLHYQASETSAFGRKRLPVQIVVLEGPSTTEGIKERAGHLLDVTARIWKHGFSEDAMDWLNWG